MSLCERIELGDAGLREGDTDHTLIGRVGSAPDQSVGSCAIDQADRAVMAQDEVLGQVANRGSLVAGVTANRQQQLVLGGCQPGRVGLLIAPAQEAAQSGAQLQQMLEVRFGERNIVLRYLMHGNLQEMDEARARRGQRHGGLG
jgi:hypothetical protein